MSQTVQSGRLGACAGMSLVELQVATIVAAILILGVYGTIVGPMAEVISRAVQDEIFTGDMDAVFTNPGNLVNPGMSSGSWLFIIYSSGGGAVADGTAGVKLYIPYSNSANGVNIFLQNGALVFTQNGATTTIVPSGVTSVSFTAAMVGSPAVRTGAVLCSLTALNQGVTYTYSTTVLPRQ